MTSLTSTYINKKEREESGLPKLKISRRGNIYTTPKDIITSPEGKKLIESLSDIKIQTKRIKPQKSQEKVLESDNS